LANQEIIDEQKTTALDFIRYVQKSDVMQYTSTPTYDAVYDEFDVNVTGVALKLNLKEIQGSTPCFIAPDDPYAEPAPEEEFN